jgi:hypothetical protein
MEIMELKKEGEYHNSESVCGVMSDTDIMKRFGRYEIHHSKRLNERMN